MAAGLADAFAAGFAVVLRMAVFLAVGVAVFLVVERVGFFRIGELLSGW